MANKVLKESKKSYETKRAMATLKEYRYSGEISSFSRFVLGKENVILSSASVTPFLHVVMKIFSWNIRGLNSLDKQQIIKRWIHSTRPSLGAFIETRVKEPFASSIIQSVVPGWRYETNYIGEEGGRIWVVWDPSLSVVIFRKSEQFVVCAFVGSLIL